MITKEIEQIYSDAEKNPTDFIVGDFILPRKEFAHSIDRYFPNGPRKILGVIRGPEYAGSQFVYCSDTDGFYGCAVYRVNFRIHRSKTTVCDFIKMFIGIS